MSNTTFTARVPLSNPGPLDPLTPDEVRRVVAEGCACGASALHPIRVRMPDGTNKAAGACDSCMDALTRRKGVVIK